jgi:hypothetical protein
MRWKRKRLKRIASRIVMGPSLPPEPGDLLS